jgi:hypothetical protein
LTDDTPTTFEEFFGPCDPGGNRKKQFPAFYAMGRAWQAGQGSSDPDAWFLDLGTKYLLALGEFANYIDGLGGNGNAVYRIVASRPEIGWDDFLALLDAARRGTFTEQMLERAKLLALARKALGS